MPASQDQGSGMKIGTLLRAGIGLLACTPAFLAQVAAAKDREPLVTAVAPTSKWVLNYDDDGCQLGRTFGSGEDRLFVALERYGYSDHLRFVLAGKAFKPLADKLEGTIRFGPGETASKVGMRVGSVGDLSPALFASAYLTGDDSPQGLARAKESKGRGPAAFRNGRQIAEEEDAHAKGIEWLAVDIDKSQRLMLQTGNLQKPLAALRACVDDLVRSWGLDPAQQARLVAGPLPKSSPSRWVSSDDYPRKLLDDGAQGLIYFRLMIDAEGKVSSCHIQRSTRPVGFDETVCRIMTSRARFEPARDESGKPVASSWRNTFTFVASP